MTNNTTTKFISIPLIAQADNTPKEPKEPQNIFITLMPFILIMVIFYFVIIRPQKNKQKALEKQISSIKKNDKIVTIGGIHATVISVREHTFILSFKNNITFEIEKTGVARVANERIEKKEKQS